MADGAPLDTDVAVVGHGPVGSALAIMLAQHGHRVEVLERQPAPYPRPRAVHFDHEVARILQACGIGSELRTLSEPAEVYEWRSAAGRTLLRFGAVGDSASGWPESNMFNQPALEAALDRRARTLGGLTVRRGAEVDGIEQTDDGVTLRTTDGASVTARYVVGCDGANSTVRDAAGLASVDLGFFYDWLIVDVVLDQPRVFDPINLQVCDPVRPTTAVSGGPGRRRWEFMRLPDETLDELNDEKRAWELLAPWDVHPGNARLERHAVYTFSARYAERWRAGRVLLAGDAAHLMPPFAGQGMCAGMRDAANLAWKLDLVLRGRCRDDLLDTYQEERQPGVKVAIELSVELGRIICVPDPAEAAARDEAMAAAVGAELTEIPALPPLDGGLIHADAPHAGHLFVQGSVDGRLFDDVHGPGWRLISLAPDSAPLTAARSEWFESVGGEVVVLADPDDTYRRWFSDRDVAFTLQRPDFYVYGTAADPAGAAALLDHLRRRLSADHAPG